MSYRSSTPTKTQSNPRDTRTLKVVAAISGLLAFLSVGYRTQTHTVGDMVMAMARRTIVMYAADAPTSSESMASLCPVSGNYPGTLQPRWSRYRTREGLIQRSLTSQRGERRPRATGLTRGCRSVSAWGGARRAIIGEWKRTKNPLQWRAHLEAVRCRGSVPSRKHRSSR
jgi:hypothetical protein